jgi:hypothetical protein
MPAAGNGAAAAAHAMLTAVCRAPPYPAALALPTVQAADEAHWLKVLAQLDVSAEQRRDCVGAHQLYLSYLAKVMAERAAIVQVRSAVPGRTHAGLDVSWLGCTSVQEGTLDACLVGNSCLPGRPWLSQHAIVLPAPSATATATAGDARQRAAAVGGAGCHRLPPALLKSCGLRRSSAAAGEQPEARVRRQPHAFVLLLQVSRARVGGRLQCCMWVVARSHACPVHGNQLPDNVHSRLTCPAALSLHAGSSACFSLPRPRCTPTPGFLTPSAWPRCWWASGRSSRWR